MYCSACGTDCGSTQFCHNCGKNVKVQPTLPTLIPTKDANSKDPMNLADFLRIKGSERINTHRNKKLKKDKR